MSEDIRVGLYFERIDGKESVTVHFKTGSGWTPAREFETLEQAMKWFAVRCSP